MKKLTNHMSDRAHHILLVVVVVVFAIAVVGIAVRMVAKIHLHYATQQQAILDVAIIKAVAAPAVEEIVLPGNVQAWHEAIIFARVNGYVKTWNSDIGAHVKAGQLLAEIEAPELDAQLRQAQADLKTAQANNQLAQSTAKRWKVLLKTESVSKQEADEKISAATANAALVNAAVANVDHLRELVSFERVTAPFDGIITSRTTDIGSLINSGSGSSLRPLFRIAEANPLRVYVKVPQNYSSSIKPGLVAELHFAEHPDQVFQGTLLDTASAIDPVSRTLLTQFKVDNQNYELLPGGYTEVHIKVPAQAGTVRLPVNTILFRSEGLRVGTLDDHGKVVLKKVKITRDFGDIVEISSGLVPGEKIIVNPSDSLFTGEQVKVVKSSLAQGDGAS